MKSSSNDFLTPGERSALMRRIRFTATQPEIVLAKALRQHVRRFETNCVDLPGKPDIAFRTQNLAVFVDGEFWHGSQWRKRGLRSLEEQFPDSSKRDQWIAKIQRNQERDLTRTAELLSTGWTVIRLWAGDVEKDPAAAVKLILEGLAREVRPSAASQLPARRVAEFFAGIGLARVALERSGWTVRFANDNAPDKILFYKTNFGAEVAHLDERDIWKISGVDVPSVALATACFPCSDLSLAGSQRGLKRGTRSSAYLRFTNILQQLEGNRPSLVLLENVVGMVHSREGRDLRICLDKLGDAGYTVDPFVLDAKSFVPHSRPRLFIVAVRDDLQEPSHISANLTQDFAALRPKRLREFIDNNPDLPWSLRPLPLPPDRRTPLSQLLESISDDDPRWWTPERTRRLYRQMSGKHRDILLAMMRSKRPKYGTVFRRMRKGASMAELRTDGLAGCLRTPKGGSARQILLRASHGKYQVRLLTPRECARLMGAGDIRIPETLSVNTALFAFGDGVCVPVVKWVADHYLTPLAAELIRGSILRSSSIS